MTNKQLVNVSRIINALLTDLEPLYALECVGQPFPWEQAQQLVLDALETAAPLLLGQHFDLSPKAAELIFHPEGGPPEVIPKP